MTQIVKAYLKLIGSPEEIRRFVFNTDVSTCYDSLVSKIIGVFPGLYFNTVTLSYKGI